MNIVEIAQDWSPFIQSSWLETLDHTPFLTRCREGVVTREELHTFVRQQYHYSRHFTRYLSALLANVIDESDRRELVQNLFEEMGLGAFGAVPHSQIYREMMVSMGVRIEDQAPFVETMALIDTMLDCSLQRKHMIGLGALCLGAEAIVPRMYSTIVHGFESIGEPVENLNFFLIHIAGDDEHAVTMRKIISRELARNPASRADLDRGAALAVAARKAFFHAISERAVSEIIRLSIAPGRAASIAA